ncbi:zf-CCHC domain-containing protein [Tanacetum coccineum]
MKEINNFQQEPDETLYQAWERFKELLLRCPQHYLTDMQEVISFYKGLDVHTRQIIDSKGAIPSMKAADAKKAIQDMADHSQKWHNGELGRYRAAATGFYQRDNGNPSYQEQRQTMEESLSKFMAESAKRDDENSNLIKEIRAATDASIRNQGASIKALKIQIGQMSKVL